MSGGAGTVHVRGWTLVGALCLAVGCGGDAGSVEEAIEAGPPDEPPPSAADALTGSTLLMADMRQSLVMLEAAAGDELPPMLPGHARDLRLLIERMNQERAAAGAPADPSWDATVDSIGATLDVMPTMTQAELDEVIEGHLDRIRRLLAEHQSP